MDKPHGQTLATSSASAREGWELIWSDEFDGETVDRTKWAFDTGNRLYVPELDMWVDGWGGGEQEYHTDRPENAFVRNGQLTIRARRENYEGFAYTSARMHTKGRFEKTYGRFEIRARLPVVRGIHCGVALFPANNAYGVWAASGEIDVMEAIGSKPKQVLGTIHFGSTAPHNTHESAIYELPHGDIGDDHIYALEWEPGTLRWYVDAHLYSKRTSWWSCSKTTEKGLGDLPAGPHECNAFPAPFDKPFYFFLCVAVGSHLGGSPIADETFPADMVIDHVRIYERADGSEREPPNNRIQANTRSRCDSGGIATSIPASCAADSQRWATICFILRNDI